MGANATTFVPAYVAGEVLTAADLSVTNSGIPVFASTVTRDAAFGGTGEKTLAEGQFAYIEATDTTQYYNGSAWLGLGGKVGQIQTATKVDAFSTSSGTFTDVTGVSVSITPSAATSTVLVIANVQGSQGGGDGAFRLMRDATAIAVSTAGSTTNGFAQVSSSYTNAMFSGSITFLDSPATTSATTYKVQAMAAGGTTYVNRRGVAADFGGFSSITVLEILA